MITMAASNDERFRRTVAAILGVSPEQITDGLIPDHVDTWDSLNHINLMAALEQEFGILFNASRLGEVHSIGQLRAALIEQGVAL